MDATIRVASHGTLALPTELQAQYNIQPGDTFHLLDLNGIFILTPKVPTVLELAQQIEQARIEAGLSMEEMLQDVREQRERYYAEKYGGSGELG